MILLLQIRQPISEKNWKNIGVRNFITLTEPNANDKNFNAVVDPVGGPDLEKYVSLLTENGVYVLNGAAGGFPGNDFGMSWLSRFQRSLTLACFSLNSIPAADIKSSLSQLFQSAIDGKIIPFVSEVFPLEDAGEAHRLLETGSVFGKIVLEI